MTIDSLVIIINLFSIAACVTLVVTWFPLFYKSIKHYDPDRSMITFLSIGIVGIGLSTFIVRQYSFAMRDLDMIWLRDTPIAPIVLGLQSLFLVIMAVGYFMPGQPAHVSGVRNYWGLWAGGATLIVMSVIAYIY